MLKELSKKIEDYMRKNYPMFMNYDFGSDLYLCGGLIRDLMINKKPKDVDLFLLNNREGVFKFIEEHKLKYKLNSFGNPKIIKDGKEIDFVPIKDFYDLIVYNADGLFYNVSQHKFVLKGFERVVNGEKVKMVNEELLHPSSKRFTERKMKVLEFEKQARERKIFEQLKKDIENGEMLMKEEEEENNLE